MKIPLLTLLCLFSATLRAEEPGPLPTAHDVRTIEGWSVRVDERLLTGENVALGEKAVKLLTARLFTIALLLPDAPLTKLREIPIQLDLTHGTLRYAQYHPNPAWLKDHGFSESLAKCVHIPEAALFLSRWDNQRMPWVMLHELAHGYHDRVLGFDEPRIKAAWEAWKAKGGHDPVLMSNGARRPHYGLTDHKEFFAEMSESYLGQNDFYPFNAGELKESDPEIFALMAEIWGPLPKR